MNPGDTYTTLLRELNEISLLDSVGGLLQWDHQTYMPPGGTEHRANQEALIARLGHEQFTSPKIGEYLDTVENSDLTKASESDAAANVREFRRAYDRARKLPAELVEELTRTSVLAQSAWVEARKNSRFPIFQPWLQKMLDLKRREADCVGYPTGNPYDALLDTYEPGETAQNVQRVFDSFRQRLVDLIAKVGASGRQAPRHVQDRKFPINLQDHFAREAAAAIGFDFNSGRLDVTVHPFCSGMGPGDTRLTTRFNETDFSDAFFSVLHETGHGLYEQGLPKKDHFGQPIAEAISLGIHESQSRMWENLVGRGRPFWNFFFPKLKQVFGAAVADVSLDQWLAAINEIRPSLIRTEADETTYNLHVMLRFELEQAMLAGQLNAAEVPAAWNEKMQSYLGLNPPTDTLGCLQDVHWSHGLIGYFPNYTLGNLYAAQFFDQAGKDLGDLDAMLSRGEFTPLLGWLREKIHRHGKRYTARQLVKRVTGCDLSAEPLMQHLQRNARQFLGV